MGWRWLAVRHARQHGHGWAEVGHALGVTAEQARQDYLDHIGQRRRVVERDPSLAQLIGYDPRQAELAQPNPADRAHQQREAADREGVGRDR
jgi:hypothetical protein